ncbi:bifunctional phosphoribosylaminoimidazolecarboxamide formyltransferase/IMP cyclohydrolase [Corynebacterium choanae]|uniref:Bifunctional purine biosynthesis protein PurH n=1 Tax=Corynebacterium choanae TaxID=1862358 RepID=A0A3G6J5B9_9CORY|nr:bifunctional phosphoribosylaminoimidazolecarboxamide formyltransferase/IMP cyclohydrolase [Corynebacterium choanae]AZA13072.1 Bifunctional purine biosynthesis protein PurH [Corynebacterium choanae]
MSDELKPISRALVSVYDKTGLVGFAQGLADAGIEIVSTGSTASTIAQAGIPVTAVESVTNFPECLDGRVKTLHPRIHAGILADTRRADHVEQLAELDVAAFQLVVVNLYPFAETVASGADVDDCVEQIDIGGPSMVRAAAKNHPSVAVVVEPGQYEQVLTAVANGGFSLAERRKLAAKAFQHTAAYDVAVASWFVEQTDDDTMVLPQWLGASRNKIHDLRYGENPHQRAALYADPAGGGVAGASQLHGKAMSYNNYVDADAAWRSCWDHDKPCVAVIKHANPCGIAVADESIAAAHAKAHACDPVSAFGGVIAANREVTAEMATQVAEIFTEVIIAPSFSEEALTILTAKKNIRILQATPPAEHGYDYKHVSGGMLVMDEDAIDAEGDDPADWELVAGNPADGATLANLKFAWRAVRAVKSNAILLAKDEATVGVGMGQVNRVDSARLAVTRAGAERAAGAVAASDAFFPFADGFEVLAEAGVTAVVQPGGSIRDEEVVEAAKQAGVTMYFTGTRHFFH